jgi:hypothetical protein
MSAPTNSVADDVLDSLAGFLAGINGPTACVTEPHYFTSVERAVRFIEDPHVYPHVTITPIAADENVSDHALGNPDALGEMMRVELTYRDLARAEGDKAQRPLDIVHDVKKALLFSDARRKHGGKAIDTYYRNWRIVPPDVADVALQIQFLFDVRLRHLSTDPSQTT